jgi:hypothetical protein
MHRVLARRRIAVRGARWAVGRGGLILGGGGERAVVVGRCRGGWWQSWAREDAFHVAFHGLLVQAVEAQAGRGRRARGAGPWEAAYGGEGVDEDAVWCAMLAGDWMCVVGSDGWCSIGGSQWMR